MLCEGIAGKEGEELRRAGVSVATVDLDADTSVRPAGDSFGFVNSNIRSNRVLIGFLGANKRHNAPPQA